MLFFSQGGIDNLTESASSVTDEEMPILEPVVYTSLAVSHLTAGIDSEIDDGVQTEWCDYCDMPFTPCFDCQQCALCCDCHCEDPATWDFSPLRDMTTSEFWVAAQNIKALRPHISKPPRPILMICEFEWMDVVLRKRFGADAAREMMDLN